MDESKIVCRFVLRAAIVVFFALIWLPIADSMFHLDRTQLIDENRAPAEFPSFQSDGKRKSLREYFSGLDAYYSDHFGFRNKLIRNNTRWKRKWFKESPVDTVMTGEDGWLYFAGNDMAGHVRGLRGFTSAELNDWQKLLETRRDYLAGQGIKYLFVIAPDKQTIYPEHLPKWLTRTGSLNKLDQFLAHMRANSTVEILDLRPVLKEAKASRHCYYSTDTHWNNYGAFLGYQTLIRTLGKQIPDLRRPLSLEDFELTAFDGPGLDLALMLGSGKSLSEKYNVDMRAKPPLVLPVTKADPSLFPGGPAGDRVAMISVNSDAQPRLLMFRDSFAAGMIPFLGYNFSRATYIFQREWDEALIQREMPDVVVDEILERLFNVTNTRQLGKTFPGGK